MIELLKPLPPLQRETTKTASLALKAALDSLGEEWRHGVLDLGAAVGANVDFFSHFSRKVTVADVLRALESQPVDEALQLEWDPVFADLLPYDTATRFDLILAWDVLNYLDRSQIVGLVRRVGQFCKEGSMLFALISTRRDIPARPRSYRIMKPDELLYQSATLAVRRCPLYKEPDLCRLMPDFQVKSSFFLRNGMQEYLFTYRPRHI